MQKGAMNRTNYSQGVGRRRKEVCYPPWNGRPGRCTLQVTADMKRLCEGFFVSLFFSFLNLDLVNRTGRVSDIAMLTRNSVS